MKSAMLLDLNANTVELLLPRVFSWTIETFESSTETSRIEPRVWLNAHIAQLVRRTQSLLGKLVVISPVYLVTSDQLVLVLRL